MVDKNKIIEAIKLITLDFDGDINFHVDSITDTKLPNFFDKLFKRELKQTTNISVTLVSKLKGDS